MISIALNFEPKGNLSKHEFNYDDGTNQFTSKVIEKDIIQGTFKVGNTSTVGTVWLRRIYFPAAKDCNHKCVKRM